MVFEQLSSKMQEVIQKRFKLPTLPQQLAIPYIASGLNTLIIAPTGSGKTEAALLKIFDRIIQEKPKPVSVLFCTPMKSLNRDMLERIMWWSKELELEVAVRHGDTSPYERQLQVEFPPDIMITTLEQLQPMLSGRNIRELLRNVKYVILDEVHETVDSKRGVQLAVALERIRELCGDFQLIMLSATVSGPDRVAKFFSGNKLVKIIEADIEKKFDIRVVYPKSELQDGKIANKIFSSKDTAARLRTIIELIKNSRATLVFTNTRDFAEILASRIRTIDKNFPAAIHHSSLSKEVRIKAEKEFKQEELKALIATSSLQLGIDIGAVDFVIQYMSPRQVTQLIQRCLPYDSKVLLSDGRFIEIGKLVEEKNNSKVTSYDPTRGFIESEIVGRHKFLDKKLIKIKLECGEEITCTLDHPILTKNGWKTAKNITKNDQIAELFYELNLGKGEEILEILDKNRLYVHGANDIFTKIVDTHLNKNKLTLKEFSKRLNINENTLANYRRLKGRKKSIPYNDFIKVLNACGIDKDTFYNMIKEIKSHDGNILKIPKTFNEEFMWLTGIVATDGCIVSYDNGAYYRIKISNRSKEIINSVIKILRNLRISPYINKRADGLINIEISNHTLVELLEKLGISSGKKSENLDISDIIFTLKNNLIYAFIKGVLDGDGCFSKRMSGYQLRLFSSSEKFIYKLHLLLARLGYYTNILKYRKKQSKLVKHTKGYLFCLSITKNELIKKFFNNIPLLGKTYDTSKLSNFRTIKNKSLDKFVRWVKIKEIFIENKSLPVYNLTLNGEPTFLVGNIITHNCGRSGHELSRVSKGIIIATDADDIFESAVISRKALARELETQVFHENSYDVLAHQLIGLTFDFGKIELEKAYDIVKRAFPYHNLSYQEFLDVCKQLERLGLAFLNGYIKKRNRGFQYYFDNLSTIPDVKQYRVINMLDRTFVGVLDEEFVALHGEPNTTFIVKGQPWRIVSVEEDKILVEPVEDIEAAIPGWEGELIPVLYDVAQEVGKLRAEVANKLKRNSQSEIMQNIMQTYPIDESCAKEIVNTIKKQLKFGIVPDNETILVEDFENLVVIHSCFGNPVNETLGRFLAALLTSRVGSIGLKTDPYRIMIQFQKKNVDLIKEILFNTKPEYLQSYLEMSLANTELFQWKFLHVAKRFGAITKDAEYGKVLMKRIIDDYVGTPVYKETLKELETEKFDIQKATEILRKIQNGEIKVVFKSGLSHLGKIGVRHKYAEVVGPEKPELEIFELFKQRLLNTQIRLACVNCGDWEQLYVVKEVKDSLKCSKCESRLLAVLKRQWVGASQIVKKALRKVGLNELERKRYENMKNRAELFMYYRSKAVKALAGKGVGPTTAKRILGKYHKDEGDLFRDILEAEKQFARTKRYWSV